MNPRTVPAPFWCLCLAAALICLATCSSDKSSSPAPSAKTGGYLITGTFQSAVLETGALEVLVTRIDGADPSAKGAVVNMNGTNVPLRALLSTDESATYVLPNFGYSAGAGYVVTVTLAGTSASCSFTAPVADYPVITAPAENALFVPGSALNIGWSYDGDHGTPEQVYLRAAPVTAEEGEDDYYYETTLTGSTTVHAVPGTETATWSDDEVVITVDLGERAWLFLGALAAPGSSMIAILPGDAVSVTNSHGRAGAAYSMRTVVYPEAIEADGQSTADLTVSIFDEQTSDPCPDGTVLVVAAVPPSLVMISPAAPTTAGGVATISITAGRATGSVAFTVTAPDLDAELTSTASITLDPQGSGSYQIAVGTGAHPTITWSPGNGMASVSVAEAALSADQAAWSIARRVIGGSWITPPLSYGACPATALQVIPPQGAAAALTPGTLYRVWLVTQTGQVFSQTFTP